MDAKPSQQVGPPFEYEQGRMEQIKKEIADSFLERTLNTVNEKRKLCLEKGLTEDETNFVLNKAIQNLQSLLPLNWINYKKGQHNNGEAREAEANWKKRIEENPYILDTSINNNMPTTSIATGQWPTDENVSDEN